MNVDPLSSSSNRSLEEFREQVVDEYLAHRDTFSRYERRHYRQPELSFGVSRMQRLFKKLAVPPDVSVLVFGGYTGQFACALQSLGATVIFTDPLEEWVMNARKLGFEAYRFFAEEIPLNLLERIELIATFECYFQLISNRIYNLLRFLITPLGLLFAESQATRRELQAESAPGGMKFSFLPFFKVYFVRRVFRTTGDLRIYHCYAPNSESRKMMFTDARVMKAIHDSLPDNSLLTVERVLSIPGLTDLNEQILDESLDRLMKLHYFDLSAHWKYELWDSGIGIGMKSFRLERSRLQMLHAL